MKAIIDNKLYDTDKAECLGEVDLGVRLYRTSKGVLFLLNQYPKEIVIDQQKVKEIVGRVAPDIYVKIYGEVEEA